MFLYSSQPAAKLALFSGFAMHIVSAKRLDVSRFGMFFISAVRKSRLVKQWWNLRSDRGRDRLRTDPSILTYISSISPNEFA